MNTQFLFPVQELLNNHAKRIRTVPIVRRRTRDPRRAKTEEKRKHSERRVKSLNYGTPGAQRRGELLMTEGAHHCANLAEENPAEVGMAARTLAERGGGDERGRATCSRG